MYGEIAIIQVYQLLKSLCQLGSGMIPSSTELMAKWEYSPSKGICLHQISSTSSFQPLQDSYFSPFITWTVLF